MPQRRDEIIKARHLSGTRGQLCFRYAIRRKDRIKFEIAGNKGTYTYYKFLYQPAIFEIVECDTFEVTATSDYLKIKTKFLYLSGNFYWCDGVLKDVDTNFKFLKQ